MYSIFIHCWVKLPVDTESPEHNVPTADGGFAVGMTVYQGMVNTVCWNGMVFCRIRAGKLLFLYIFFHLHCKHYITNTKLHP